MASTQIPMSGLKTQVAVGDGSAGAPSISFSNDANTGLYRPGSDTVGIVTGGVERMRVDSGGNVGVGIGAGTPITRLEIKGTTNYASMTTNPIGAGAVVTTSTGSQRLYLGAYYTGGVGSASAIQSSDFFNSIDNAGPLILNPLGGNVGIGSTNPQAKLDVQGSIKSLNPCFYAYRIGISPSAFTTVGGVLPLNTAEVNVQNVYDTTNYIFTAPISGIYRFSIGALHRGGSAGSTLELTIEKRTFGSSTWVNNGNQNTASSRRALTYSYTPSGGGHSMVTGFALRSLSAGDSIRAVMSSLVTSGDVYIGEGLTYFEGYLIG